MRKRLLAVSLTIPASATAFQVKPVQAYQKFIGTDVEYSLYNPSNNPYQDYKSPPTTNSDAAKDAFLLSLSTPYETENFENTHTTSTSIDIKSPVKTTFNGRYPNSANKLLATSNFSPGGIGQNSFNFDSPVNAIGFYVTGEISMMGAATTLVLTKIDGTTYSAPLPSGSDLISRIYRTKYVGIIAENASETFTKATFQTSGLRYSDLGIDNVTIAANSRSVPEPSAVAGLGLFVAGLTRSKQLKEKIKNKLAA